MPNRFLKESICFSEDIDKLKPFTEIFFYRLIVNCDDFGRFDARDRVLKSKLFPLKDSVTLKNIGDSLRELASIGLVVLYEVDGRPFLFLPTWDKHQNRRATKSRFPSPDDGFIQLFSSDSKCARTRISDLDTRISDLAMSEQSPDEQGGPDKFSADSDEMKLSQFLFKKIQERDPRAKRPDFQKWCEHIGQLIHIDKRVPKEIQDVIVWCQKDEFWQSNILSTEKLRKQFGQLVAKMNSKAPAPNGHNRKTGGSSYDLEELERMTYGRVNDETPM